MKTIAIAGTFDTKGREFAYVKDLIESLGLGVFSIHAGVYDPVFKPDVSNTQVAAAAGADLTEIAKRHDRALATKVMSEGMEKLVPELFAQGKFDGILSFGGSGGTSLVTPAMRALPIGVPKLMVSTMASGNVSQYVGTSDILMMPSIVDVSGLNSISTKIFSNAVFAMAGMVTHTYKPLGSHKPLVAASMFGVTTPCITAAQKYLEAHGYEVLVFHATGTGGRTMESLIKGGFIKGVLDLTTTEWCDEIVGGVLNAGPDRCSAAPTHGIPLVISVGATDMVNFGPWESVPEKFRNRNLYRHNPTVTLMRTTADECRKIGEKLAEKINLSEPGKTVLMLPLGGVSAIDAPGQPYYGPEEDKALFDTLKAKVDTSKVQILEMPENINDAPFAEAAAQRLIELMQNHPVH